MNYLIFTVGLFIGVIIGFFIASLCNMAHDGDRCIDDAARWERIRQEMARENLLK